jgi:DNA-directed RNA polymerase, mitochondrial
VFKEGKILNEIGVEALKIYSANCYGLNKLSYNDRLNWVEYNLNKIINLETDFIFKASEPLLFLATCFELKGYYQDKENFISTLPIYLDATCNGLQHLSSMINDANLAKFVNIVKSSKNDIPNDVYNKMVENVNININSLIETYPEFSKLKLLNVNRTFIKNGIMTIPYGVTTRGISSQLIKEFFILLNPVKGSKRAFILQDKNFLKNQDINLTLTFKEIFKLAEIIHNVLYNSFPNLTVVVKYLKDINRFLKLLGLSTVWLTPSGMLIEQHYSKIIKEELVTNILGKRKSITINKIDKNTINLQKQNSGIVPNLVHSLDASNIALLIKKWDTNLKDIDILTIHDCFGCQGNNVQIMLLEIKLAFLSIYGNGKFISSYHKFILEYVSKSGFEILDNNTVNIYKDKFITVPKEPIFPENKSFKESVLMSQYLFN